MAKREGFVPIHHPDLKNPDGTSPAVGWVPKHTVEHHKSLGWKPGDGQATAKTTTNEKG